MISSVFQLGAIVTLQDQMSSGLLSIKKNWDNLKVSLGEGDKRVIAMENSMKRFSTGAKLLGVGLAGAFMLKGPLEDAVKFDAALGELKAISGATTVEMERLRQKAIEAGIATEFDPTQAVKGLTSLASVGMDAETSIKALDASLNLATASMGKLSVDQASSLIAAVEKGFGRGNKATADDFNYISSVFVNMANMTNYSMDEMEQSFRGILSVLPNYNQELESSAAIMMALKSNMKTAVGAGETLRIVTNNLATGTPKAKEEMEKLGVSAYDNVTKKFRPVIDIIEDLSLKLGDYSEEQRNAKLQTILGVDGLAAYGAVVGAVNQQTGSKGVQAIREWTNAIKENKNATNDFAKIKLETFAGQVGLLNGVWSTFKLLMGENLQAALKPMLVMLNAIATPIVNFLKENPRIAKFVATFAMIGVTALTVAGGIMVVTSAFKMFTLAVNLGLISNPFGWVVLGIGAAIVAISLLITNWDLVSAAAVTAWNWLKNTWGNMSGFAKLIVLGIAPFIAIPMLIYENWDSISELFFTIADSLSFLGGAFDGVAEEWNSFVNGIGMLKNMLLEVWGALPSEFKEILIMAMVSPVLGLGSLIWNAFSKVYTNIKARMTEGGMGFIQAFIMGMLDSVNDLKESVSKVFSVVARFLPHSDAAEGPLSAITKSGKAFVTTFAYGMNSAKNNLRPAIAGAMNEVKDGVSGESLLSQAWDGFKNIGSKAMEKASAGIDKVKEFGKKSGAALIETFSEGIDSAKGFMDGSISKVFGKSKEQFPQSNAKRGAFSNLSGSGKALMETFAEGVQSAEGMLNPVFAKLASPKSIDPIVNSGNVVNNESNSRQTTIQANKLVEIVINGSNMNLSPDRLGRMLLDAINEEMSRYEAFA